MRMRIVAATVCLVLLVVGACMAEEAKTEPLVLEAGPIWNNDHAKERCPEVLAEWLAANPGREATWTGHWTTTVANEMSICQCEAVVVDGEDDAADFDAYWNGREVEFDFTNRLPIEVRKITVTTGGKTYTTNPTESLLAGQKATIKATIVDSLDAIAFDTPSADFVFADLTSMPKSDTLHLVVRLSGDAGALECTGADGEEALIDGTADIFAPEDDMDTPIAFSEILDAENIAAIRSEYQGDMKKTRHGFALWTSFADEKWLAVLKPADFDADGETDECAVRVDAVGMCSPNHYAKLEDTFAAIREMGFRPWRAWHKHKLGDYEGVAGLKAADYDTEKLDGDDVDAVWEAVKEEMVEKEFPEDHPWVVKAMFITDTTFNELQAGENPTPQPVVVLRRDNGIFYEMTYMRDGRQLLEKAAE